MYKKIQTLLILGFVFFINNFASAQTLNNFNVWLNNFKNKAISQGISAKTVNSVMENAKFLPKVIEYDRFQPEFYEDTFTYIKKRTNKQKVKKGLALYDKETNLINKVENEFLVEKELLLALMGIETNYGKYLGKMDIISSLATLSFDKRRSDFFSSELLTLLELVDNKLIDPKTLYGSWAGAYGNFQFMPSTIKTYAIDYDQNNKIELKTSLRDSLASAANYINRIGWKRGEPCFFRVKLTSEIKKKYLNTSARKISNKLKISKWKKKGIVNYDGTELVGNQKAALILPDGKPETPIFLVFDNYEKILKWNRSLRFGISICTLANMIKA